MLCSRLSREKRPDLAIEALRVMHRGGFPARLIVAGSGPLAASLRRRAEGLPVELVGHLGERSSVAAGSVPRTSSWLQARSRRSGSRR